MIVSANYQKSPWAYCNMVIKQMQKTKIIIALVAIAAITLTIVGLASAQIIANQNYTNPSTTPNPVAPNNWLLGLDRQLLWLKKQPTLSQPIHSSASARKHYSSRALPTLPSGYYGYGYGRCMAGW